MEVGEHRVDRLKLMAGMDEDAGFAGVGLERLPLSFTGDVFQRTDGGGSYGDYAAIFCAGAVESFCRICGEGVAFPVKMDLGESLYA